MIAQTVKRIPESFVNLEVSNTSKPFDVMIVTHTLNIFMKLNHCSFKFNTCMIFAGQLNMSLENSKSDGSNTVESKISENSNDTVSSPAEISESHVPDVRESSKSAGLINDVSSLPTSSSTSAGKVEEVPAVNEESEQSNGRKELEVDVLIEKDSETMSMKPSSDDELDEANLKIEITQKTRTASTKAMPPCDESTLENDIISSNTSTVACSPNDDDTAEFATPSASFRPSIMNDNENSSDSTFSEDVDLLGVPNDMVEEERKFALQTKLEIAERAKNTVQLDLKEKEKRYKTLMNLLGKSNQYALYLSQKLAENNEAAASRAAVAGEPEYEESPQVLRNSNRATKRKRRTGSGTKAAAKKAKPDPTLPYDPKTHYQNRMGFIVSRRQPQILIGGIMRDYQLDGLEWMVSLYKNGVNGILADEMGLGKTIQTIALLCHLREKKIFGPHLIVAPLSTLPNWIFEFANFAPDIPVVLYHGNAEKRNGVKNEFAKILMSKDASKLPVVLTSYEMPLRDTKFLSVVKWCYSIVDEGHRLKNYQSMLSQTLRRYKTDTRLLLTGTPLQNNLTELWSLLNYLIPEIFDNLPLFEDLFDFSDLRDSEKQNQLIQKEKEEKIVSTMHQILEPFLLRRVKTDVKIAIPRKKEILVYAPLTAEQEGLYKSVLDRSMIEMAQPKEAEPILADGEKRRRKCTTEVSYSEDWDIDENFDYIPKAILLSKSTTRKRVTSGNIEFVYNMKFTSPDMMLRKIVNHPYLVKTPVYAGTRDIVINEDLIQKSGKLLVLDALLPRLKKEGHKVLLFSTFRIMLDLLEDYVIMRKHKYVRLDGLNKIEDRLVSIKQFNSDPETFIFLISTRAGGLGINLTAADTVIIYNSDWNPQVDLQAQDRCHRIGQTRPVVVYRLVMAGTVDERITNTATSKRRLEKLVMQRGKFKQQVVKKEEISLSELKELLESTDYKQVIHPNGLVLSDEQIGNLLDRSDLLKEEETDQTAEK